MSLAVAACFTWSLALATSARAATYHAPVRPGHTRSLSAKEMRRIVGSTFAPIGTDPNPGSDPTANVGSSPGTAYPWEGTVGDVKTDNGNKQTTIPIVGWTARGGLAVSVALTHNSLANAGNTNQTNGNVLAPKWTSSYEVALVQNSSTHNVTVYWGDGQSYSFTSNINGTYSAPAGVYDTLTPDSSDGSFNIVTKSQVKYHFGSWGAAHYLLSISDENGNTININRDSGAHTQTVVDPNGRTLTYGYTNGQLTSFTDPMNRVWHLTYSNGELNQVHPPSLSGGDCWVQLGYDGSNNITAQSDLMGHFSHFAYNSDSTISWEQTPLGSQTSFYYGVDLNGNANSLATTIAAPDAFKTTHFYDSYGHLTTVKDTLGYTENLSNYDANNNAQTVQDKRGFNWYYTFDGKGNVLTTKSPMGSLTTLQYNSHNKPTYIKAPNGEQVALTYDGSDNLTQVQNKDASGNVKATTKFAVSASTYGLVLSKTDADNHVTTYGYGDGYGDLTDVSTPLGRQTHWTYNADGVATSRTDPLGITATYTLDAWNRTTAISYSSGLYSGSDGNKTYGYDVDSNLTSFSNSVGSYTRSYDGDNRMLEEDRNGARQVSHTYDGYNQQGLLSTTTDADGNVTSYAYTHRNELASVSAYSHTSTYAYDADGRELTVNDAWGNFATKTWDNDGRLGTLVNKDPRGNYLSGYGYGYNSDNQKTSCAEYGTNGGGYANVSWGYDPLGHLNSESRTGGSPRTASYTVDGVGNRTSQTINGATTTFSYDNDDELTGDSTGSIYQYDANGNMNGRRRNNNWIYPYSTNENQIAQIYTGGQNPTYSYGYDALGRQAYRYDQNNTRTDYQYDGDAVLTETQNGSVTSRYLLGTNRLLKYGEAPQLDGLGSMRQGVDTSSGVFTGQTDYSAFGEVIGGNNTGAFQSVYQWQAQSGYRMDGGSGGGGDCGLVKVGARYYDPAVGRFTSRDSDIMQSAYVYCYGDPINFVDFTGHEGVSPDAKFGSGHNYIGLGVGLAVSSFVALGIVAVTVVTVPLAPVLIIAAIAGFAGGALTGYGARLLREAKPRKERDPRDPREPVASKGGIPGSAGFGITTSFSADPNKILQRMSY